MQHLWLIHVHVVVTHVSKDIRLWSMMSCTDAVSGAWAVGRWKKQWLLFKWVSVCYNMLRETMNYKGLQLKQSDTHTITIHIHVCTCTCTCRYYLHNVYLLQTWGMLLLGTVTSHL